MHQSKDLITEINDKVTKKSLKGNRFKKFLIEIG